MDIEVRKSLAEIYHIRKNYDSDVVPAEVFIRIRHHANELPLKRDILLREGYAFELTCGRVTDAWLERLRMKEGFCSYITGKNAFKNLGELKSRVGKIVKNFRVKRDSRKTKRGHVSMEWVERDIFRKKWNPSYCELMRSSTWDLSDVFTSEY